MVVPTRALAASLLVTAGGAGAEQDSVPHRADDGRLEEVVVIGSRARLESRADELPVPVDVHQGFDLERAGEIDLGAALTKLAPSFNYSRLSVGDGALLNAATLRGLAPDQTLVLVNGKRRHNMAWTRVLDGVIGYGTGGTDLRAIPSAAVARVEVLRDGAAAQYGSDAIAGVINLALKESMGGEVVAYGGSSQDAEGGTAGVSVNAGAPLGADGFVNVTAEVYRADALRRNGGNGGFDPNYQDELVTFSAPSHEGATLFANATLPVGEASELYAFGGMSRRGGALERRLPLPLQLLGRNPDRRCDLGLRAAELHHLPRAQHPPRLSERLPAHRRVARSTTCRSPVAGAFRLPTGKSIFPPATAGTASTSVLATPSTPPSAPTTCSAIPARPSTASSPARARARARAAASTSTR